MPKLIDKILKALTNPKIVPTVGFAPTSSLSGCKQQLHVLWDEYILSSVSFFLSLL